MADNNHSTDRDDFGHWLSGFTDGEGCFSLYWRQTRTQLPRAAFVLELRSDDTPILQSIRDYLGAGQIYTRQRKAAAMAILITNKIPILQNVIIPHFDRYPLRAKKSRDFLIWREAVLLLADVKRRPIVHYTFGHGTKPRYTPDELRRFQKLSQQLRAVRRYNSSSEPLPPRNGHKSTDDQQLFHFDQ